MNNRREFLALLGGAAVAWPLAARAQQPAVPIVGFLRSEPLADAMHLVTAFRAGLKEAGFAEDQNVTIELRSAEGQADRLPALVTELIRRPAAVIVANSLAAVAAITATSRVPITTFRYANLDLRADAQRRQFGRCHQHLSKRPVQDDVPYMTQALREDLYRLRNAWEDCQANRDRDAIYGYLTTVFDLVAWWFAEDRALERAQKALRLHNIRPAEHDEPFAAVIRCTANPAKVDKRTRSKWSRALRYALAYKSHSEPLDQFIKRKGGINRCAARFARSLGARR
jgi:hypothetical protein